MGLPFTKMHGIGNDFVVVDRRTRRWSPDPARIRAMADRHTGIGFDQLLTIERGGEGGARFAYGIWNADGSPAGQCGNGVRCVAAWLHRAGALALDTEVQVDSPSGTVGVRLLDAERVIVDMGVPQFAPAGVPFDAPAEAASYTLQVDGAALTLGAVSLGNPHAVTEVAALEDPLVDRLGPRLTTHERFAEGCNAGFARVLDAGHVALRVHERGAGWTRACGTGACAAMAVLQRQGRVGTHVDVALPGGHLQIDWDGAGHTLWMNGPAAFVFDGEWHG